VIKIRKFNEEFYDAINYGNYHEIFVNPTKKELDIVYNEGFDIEDYRGVRFIGDNSIKKLYVFNSSILHSTAVKKIFNKPGRILLDPDYQMISGIIENDDYIVSSSDSLMYDIKKDNNSYMLEFLLETDWSWLDKYIYFSDWWDKTMVPELILQSIKVEQGLEDID